MSRSIRVRVCRTKGCGEWIDLRGPFRLCRSCRYLGKRMFALGAFVAGVIAWVLR